MDRPSDAFRATVRAVAADAGQHLSDAALDALVSAVDASPDFHYLSRYHAEPPHDLVAARLAPYLAKNTSKTEGVSKYGRESGGVDPQTFASLSASQRLTLVREFDAKHTPAKPTAKTFPERRLEADLHGARLRLHSLQGADRERQAQRVAELERQLAEARAR